MKLINLKNGKVAAGNLFFAKTFVEKAKGLLGRGTAVPLYFKTRMGIHTFGMKFPIDVLICNNKLQVMRIFENVRSGKVVFWNPVWVNVFELPVGTVETAGIALGDQLQMV